MLRDPNLIPLSHQHHNALAMCVLTRRSLREDASPANVAKLARRAIDRYELELVNHFEIEEQILFPAIEGTVGKLSLVKSLEAEHRQVEGSRRTIAHRAGRSVVGAAVRLARGPHPARGARPLPSGPIAAAGTHPPGTGRRHPGQSRTDLSLN
jgi:hypothetical protein